MRHVRRRLVQLALSGLAAAVVLAGLPATGSATGSAAKPLWRYRTGEVCIQTNGWRFWPVAEAARRWNAAPDVALYVRADCRAAGFPRSQTVQLAIYRDARRRECGFTSAGRWLDHGGVVRTMTIRLNLSTARRAGCFATSRHRAHVISHELGHGLGLPHGGSGVMDSWSHTWPTGGDLRDLERVHPW